MTQPSSELLSSLAWVVVERLKAERAWLFVAESCTGGLIADAITDIPGASEVFWGGWNVYHNHAKELLAQVPPLLIEKYGAVSDEVARALAEGSLRQLNQAALHAGVKIGGPDGRTLFALATTGIAGPGGGSREKPVGLCQIGVTSSGHPTEARAIQVEQDPKLDDKIQRRQNKAYFARRALELLLGQLNTRGDSR